MWWSERFQCPIVPSSSQPFAFKNLMQLRHSIPLAPNVGTVFVGSKELSGSSFIMEQYEDTPTAKVEDTPTIEVEDPLVYAFATLYK